MEDSVKRVNRFKADDLVKIGSASDASLYSFVVSVDTIGNLDGLDFFLCLGNYLENKL
jgi:hypothetical protein